VQGECAGRTDQPVLGPSATAAEQLNMVSLCPLGRDQGKNRIRISRNQEYLANLRLEGTSKNTGLPWKHRSRLIS
jgi:hypothetical protein